MAATQAQLNAVFDGVYVTDGDVADNAAALDAAMTASVGASVDQASTLAILAAMDEPAVFGDNVEAVDITASGDIVGASVDATGNIDAATFSVAGDSGADATVLVATVGTLTFTKGILTTFTAA